MAIKVLLVEDDRALREALADTLLLAGHDYEAVGSAEEALATMQRIMGQLKLTVNWTKTRVCRLPEEKIDFMG